MKRFLAPLALLTALSAASLMTPGEAEACGGTFCDTGPMSMPVDQSGENILFVLDGQNVEAHVQIMYDPNTDAENFAWVLPLLTLPEFEVGSDRLFENLLAGTVPTYGYNTIQEPCGDGGDTTGDGDGDTTGGDGDGDGDTGGPDIVFQDVVGAFEITVLQGGTIEEVMTWLGDNGYQQDPAAEPILAEYLAEGYLFAAFKLATGADVPEIHPVVLRYQGNEPCVPLRLTRIAAVEDMDVRAFVLSTGRAVPTNYRHVLVNPLMIDWINFASNYKEVVSMAVDAFAAEGNAFVTEYAGPSNVVSQAGIYSASWDAAPFAALQNTPEDTMMLLEAQGLASCEFGQCQLNHMLLEPIVQTYLPVPDGVTPEDFYGCLPCYAGLIDGMTWDAAAFAAELDERVIAPGAHAVDLLETWPYLTRLFTTISPNEMVMDPIFHINSDLPDVPNIRNGTRELLCAGGATFDLPDGRQVYLPNPNSWPTFPDEMPWEEDVELAAMVGPNQVLSDRTALIDQLLEQWNQSHNWPPGSGDGDGDTGDGDGDTGDGDTATGGGSGSGGSADAGDGTDGAGIDDASAACACSSEEPGGKGGALGVLALLGLGLVRRRGR